MNRNRSLVLVLMLASQIPAAAARPGEGPRSDAPPAARVFEKLKALAGDWEGKTLDSRRPDGGRTERLTYQVIADGSCIMETSRDGAHPGHTMATMFH